MLHSQSKKSLLTNLFVLSLSLGLTSIPLLTNKVQAQSTSNTSTSGFTLSPNPVLSANITPPQAGSPSSTVGGASRGGRCSQDSRDANPYLTSLLPINGEGLTLQEKPDFFVYIPETVSQKAFFSLKDSQGNHYYQTYLDIADQSGILKFSLPEDAPALEANKDYKWSFVILCDNRLRPDSPLVEGEIKRIELENNSQLKQDLQKATSAMEKAQAYAKAGIWYETLGVLAQLRQSNPHDTSVNTTWTNLLNSVGLNNISNAELL
jgi:hypothetical protein